MSKKKPPRIAPPSERSHWWDKPPGSYSDCKASDEPGWVMSEVLLRWYRGMSHLARARMLVYGSIDTLTGLDLDANWWLAVIDSVAAVDTYGKLPEIEGDQRFNEFKQEFDGYRSYRHSIVHILLNTQMCVTIDESPLGIDASVGIIPKTDRRNSAETPAAYHAYPGISQGIGRSCIAIADYSELHPLAGKMFKFWDRHLSRHPEFEIAFDSLEKKVKSSYDFDPSFRTHVLEHRLPLSNCEFCYDFDRSKLLAPNTFFSS